MELSVEHIDIFHVAFIVGFLDVSSIHYKVSIPLLYLSYVVMRVVV